MAFPQSNQDFKIRQEAGGDFLGYGQVSIAFEVSSVFDVNQQKSGLTLVERRLDSPYIKNYDDVDEDRPAHWPQRFDTGEWVVFSAWQGDRRLGGMALAWRTPELTLVPYRQDRAILWDLRVAPGARGRGVGRRMMAAMLPWAREQRIVEIFVETQNINVPACRFYAAQGFELFSIKPLAYPELPDEVQLLWRLALN